MKRSLFLLLGWCAVMVSSASARTWVVLPDSTGDAPSIQAGIDSAGTGDTVMVMTGTYYEHDICLKPGIHLVSETGIRDCVTIDAEDLGRVFVCLQLSSATSVTGFTAANGTHIDGGGMYCDSSDAVFTECRFMYNSAVDTNGVIGGGVYLLHGSPVFTDCDFLWNSVECTVPQPACDVGEGGGVYARYDSPQFIRCTFSHNSVDCNCGAVGGGFSCSGSCSPTLEECVFDSNSAGGVYLANNCDATVSGCIFRGNVCAPCCVGGGMICRSDDAIITDCLFEGNTGGQGGGINFRYATPSVPISNCRFIDNIGSGVCVENSSSITFTNCLFAGNHEPAAPWGQGGGGVLVKDDSAVELVACTFYGNSTDKDGGGIYCGEGSHASLDHCIVAFSTDGEALYWDGTGTEPDLGCCDLYGNEGGDWVGPIADQYGVNGNISEDPLFCDPDNYDFSLCPGSPCHVAGGCGTIGAYGWITGFGLTSIEDVGEDQGGFLSLTWNRNWYDCPGGDTAVDFYSIWRRDDGELFKGGEVPARSMAGALADYPGEWECIDSVAASGQETYTVVCPTVCDSSDAGLCWSVFFVRAHCPAPVLEFDALPDSGYSYDNTAYEAWTDATTSVLRNRYLGAGLAWVDYDDDGDLDLFVTSRYKSGVSSKNQLYRNDNLTAEGFVNATPPVLAVQENSRGCAWGDYDGDGDLDLYISNKGVNELFRNDGDGSFVDVTAAPLDDAGTGHTASWADYDNDGDVDLYLANNGPNKLFRNDGAGGFTDVTSGPLGDDGFGTGFGWADYDNDGDLDIYVANYTGANVLLENEGGGVFSDATTPVLGIAAASYGVAWGDYDNDGDLDLYVSNEGPNNLLLNSGGSFTDVTTSPLDDTGDGRGVAWADYNLDGFLDLYVVNFDGPDDGANRLLENLGNGSFVRRGSGSCPFEDTMRGLSAAWGDYDKDGDPDLYVVNDWNCGHALYRNDLGPGHHWLEVRLRGILSNTFGQGARVYIVTGAVVQMREIAGASGYASQGPLTAMFGLGTACMVDTVRVSWPVSGTVQTVEDVACDQSVEIIEGALSRVHGGAETPAALRLYPNRPNPFRSATLIGYDLPKAAHVDLDVFDITGRSVRTLLDHHPTSPGRHTAMWDGRNADGRPVGPGIYFCRLSVGSRTQIQRMVLLK